MALFCDLQLVYRNSKGDIIARAKARKVRTTKRFFHVEAGGAEVLRPNPANIRMNAKLCFSKDSKKPVGHAPWDGAHWAIAEIDKAYEG